MQAKMMKPQMVQLGVSFLYIFIWIFVLTPTYGNTSMVYLPGIGSVSSSLLVPNMLVLPRHLSITHTWNNAN